MKRNAVIEIEGQLYDLSDNEEIEVVPKLLSNLETKAVKIIDVSSPSYTSAGWDDDEKANYHSKIVKSV